METSKFSFFTKIHRVTRDVFTTDRNIKRNPLCYTIHIYKILYIAFYEILHSFRVKFLRTLLFSQ